MNALKLGLVFVTLLSVSGCYTTTVRSGRPVGQAAVEVDERWHSGFLLGNQEASGPYDLERICPEGWAKVDTETSFGNGVVELFTAGVYNPQSVTVTCAAPAPKQAAKAEGGRQN